jgi:ESX secretion system protein EccE
MPAQAHAAQAPASQQRGSQQRGSQQPGSHARPGHTYPPRPTLLLVDRMSVLGVPAWQLMVWQLMAAAAVVAFAQVGVVRWVLVGAVVVGLAITVPRWRHRWAYQWLVMAWSFRRARRAASGAPVASDARAVSAALPLTVIPVRLRSGAEAGIVHDGDGFAVMVAVTHRRTSSPVTDLPIAALAGLLDPHDNLICAVQVVVHGDLTAGEASAYRELGYHHMPRSQSAWVALRHDPTASGYAVGTPGELHASLMRALAGRGLRAVDLLGDLGLSAQLLDAESAREVVHRALLAPESVSPDEIVAQPRPAHSWRSWHSATRGHVTFWLRRWPPSGMRSLQQALAAMPALSATMAVFMTRDCGRIGFTATVRVATEPGADQAAISRAVDSAAASCGARLVRLNGDHVAGVLATLPIGRGLATAVRWAGRHAEAGAGLPATVLPIEAGG